MAAPFQEDPEVLTKTICVENFFRENIRKEELKRLFENYGTVSTLDIIQPRNNNRCAIITFASASSAQQAFKAAKSRLGIYYEGQRLNVSLKRVQKADKRKLAISEPALIHKLDQFCMLHIFDYLTLAERILCEKVCKLWQEFSLQTWSTLTDVSFFHIPTNQRRMYLQQTTNALKSIHFGDVYKNDQLLEFLECVPSSVTKVTLNGKSLNDLQVLNALATALPNLEVISIEDNNLIPEKAQSNWLSKLQECFPKLKEVLLDGDFSCQRKLPRVIPLQKFHFRYHDAQIGQNKAIELHSEELQELSLICPYASKASSVKLICPQLKVLRLEQEDTTALFMANFSKVPQLQELTISSDIPVKEVIREDIIKSCTTLKKLKLVSSDLQKSSLGLEQLQRLPLLTHLVIDRNILPGKIEAILKLEKLEKLSMRETEPVSYEEMVSLITGLPKLTYFDVSGIKILADNGERITDIEELCSECPSAGRPTLELVIAGCGLDQKENIRWKSGRFIFYNPKWQEVDFYWEEPSEDLNSDSFESDYSYSDNDNDWSYDESQFWYI